MSAQTFCWMISKANFDKFKNMVDNDESLFQYMLDNTTQAQRMVFKNLLNPEEITERKVMFFLYNRRPDMARVLETNKGWLKKQIDEFKNKYPNL